MLGKTHHAGGTLAALVAFEVLRNKGLLIPDCNEFIQLLVMYPFASFGSIFSDLDHGPDSIPSKDPVAFGINKLLKLTGAKHRSWQTHSILFTGGCCALMFGLLTLFTLLNPNQYLMELAILRLVLIGFVCGVSSHLILDSLTTAGIYIFPGFKLRFVPKTSTFATGGTWENIIFWLLIIGIVLLLIKICIIEGLWLWCQPLILKIKEIIGVLL